MMNKKQPNPIDVHVGARVRLRRMMIGMSQEKLGDALGITFQQIQKYEKGTNRIGASRLQHAARVLKVPVSFFFEDAPGAVPGVTNSPNASYVVDFLSSPEGVQLNKAFIRIKDAKLRRKVIELVRAMAGEPDPEEEVQTSGGVTETTTHNLITGEDHDTALLTGARPAKPVPPSQWGKRAHAAHA